MVKSSYTITETNFMKLAIAMGRQGLGKVCPNPSVGCVIVKEGHIIAKSRTADGGRPHAETEAVITSYSIHYTKLYEILLFCC